MSGVIAVVPVRVLERESKTDTAAAVVALFKYLPTLPRFLLVTVVLFAKSMSNKLVFKKLVENPELINAVVKSLMVVKFQVPTLLL